MPQIRNFTCTIHDGKEICSASLQQGDIGLGRLALHHDVRRVATEYKTFIIDGKPLSIVPIH
jgi:hypothetical protein